MPRNWSEKDLRTLHKRKGLPLPPVVAIRATSPYKNGLEEAFAYTCVAEKQAGLIRDWGYEVMTLKLAKGKYHRPDFTKWHMDGSIEQAAVKGYHKNMRDSLTLIKWACKEHPWFRFTINRRDCGAWSKEAVEV